MLAHPRRPRQGRRLQGGAERLGRRARGEPLGDRARVGLAAFLRPIPF